MEKSNIVARLNPASPDQFKIAVQSLKESLEVIFSMAGEQAGTEFSLEMLIHVMEMQATTGATHETVAELKQAHANIPVWVQRYSKP